MPDPRVFFAAERTLLAWIRSGLTVMALGFVVARFGLFLTLLSAPTGAHAENRFSPALSGALGIALVMLGATAILGALYNHRTYVRSLPPEDIPRLAMPWFTSLVAASVAVAGLVMAAYLAIA